jgi:hypothetical protein
LARLQLHLLAWLRGDWSVTARHERRDVKAGVLRAVELNHNWGRWRNGHQTARLQRLEMGAEDPAWRLARMPGRLRGRPLIPLKKVE